MKAKYNGIIDDSTQFNGKGTESVYVYTFESLAKRKNRKKGMIKMKIGMTTQPDPYDRIKQQIGASGHEKVILMHIFKTHKGYQFEKNIHNKLKKMGRHISKKDAIGTEWFWVKEKEVTRILKESYTEIEREFPRKGSLLKSHDNAAVLMILALPFAMITGLFAVPAFIIAVIGSLMLEGKGDD